MNVRVWSSRATGGVDETTLYCGDFDSEDMILERVTKWVLSRHQWGYDIEEEGDE